MNIRNFIIIVFCFFAFNFMPYSFAVCKNQPDFVQIYSGSNYMGQFNTSDSIFIDSDLSQKPLKARFYFQNMSADCYNTISDFRMKLFQTSSFVPASNIYNNSDYLIVEFVYNPDIKTSSSFISNYAFSVIGYGIGTGNLNFFTDNIAPVFTDFYVNNTDLMQKGNSIIEISYSIEDSGSGLKMIKSNIPNMNLVELNGTKNFTDTFEFELSTSKTIRIEVYDKLDNMNFKEITYNVDSTAPTISNFNSDSYSKNSQGQRTATFTVEVKDESFSGISNVPVVNADFSQINDALLINAKCTRKSNSNDSFICYFYDVPISKVSETSSFDISVCASDVVGNNGCSNFSSEIFYDSSAPIIHDFYLTNRYGIRNTFTSSDQNVIVNLLFSDESIKGLSDIRIIPDFDSMQTFITPKCVLTENGSFINCAWNISKNIKKYDGIEGKDVSFKIKLVDPYGNIAEEKIDIKIDNVGPKIIDVVMTEKSDIKDGIISSKEEIDFIVYINGTDLAVDYDLVYADFSQIDYSSGMKRKSAQCNLYNETSYECYYDSVVVENGYINGTVKFYAIDYAGNTEKFDYYVEVFAIGDEVFSSFKIEDIDVTNYIDKNMLAKSSVNGWFEGIIINMHENSRDIKIVNYQLLGCNDSMMNPILIGERNLYPTEVVMPDESLTARNDFILKMLIKPHPNKQDLVNGKTMKCSLSVLKRDNETVYQPEIVSFNVRLFFYDLPYNDLLQANAKKILDMIDDSDFLGSWFDTLYNILDIFGNICGLLNKVSGLMQSVSTITTVVQHYMSYGTGGAWETLAEKLGTVYAQEGQIQKIRSMEPIKTMCDFVTCNLAFNNNAFLDKLNGFADGINEKVASAICEDTTGDD